MNSTRESDDERVWVIRARGGDRAAFTRLVDAYDRRLLYFINRILGDQTAAFDVLQQVWLTVHRKLHRLQSPCAFRVWLYRIAHDCAVNEIRKKSRRPVPVENLENSSEPDQYDAEAAFDNAEIVHLGLERLSTDHRRILTLRFLEEMKVDDIAQVLGCRDGTVKSRLHYALRALRMHVEEIERE